MSAFDDLVTRALLDHEGQLERSITAQVGLLVRQTVKVDVRRPRWMPRPLYQWLLRTIVVETGPLRVEAG